MKAIIYDVTGAPEKGKIYEKFISVLERFVSTGFIFWNMFECSIIVRLEIEQNQIL